MQVVYFGEELNARAPEIVGILCSAPGGEWITILDIVGAIQRCEVISIRPASEGEKNRAEVYIALHELGTMLGQKMGKLLDQENDKEATRAITAVIDGIVSIDADLPVILDREGA